MLGSPSALTWQGLESFGNLPWEMWGVLADPLQCLQSALISVIIQPFFFLLSHAVCQKQQVVPDASDCYLAFHKLTLHLQGDKQ